MERQNRLVLFGWFTLNKFIIINVIILIIVMIVMMMIIIIVIIIDYFLRVSDHELHN